MTALVGSTAPNGTIVGTATIHAALSEVLGRAPSRVSAATIVARHAPTQGSMNVIEVRIAASAAVTSASASASAAASTAASASSICPATSALASAAAPNAFLASASTALRGSCNN
mmetsp:Transcript_33247/g.88279  ORF Transcript_33247/g.88279 Transcript_33247/m.88279 type:complete len:115 (-) Transcript_33247:25-369(-)